MGNGVSHSAAVEVLRDLPLYDAAPDSVVGIAVAEDQRVAGELVQDTV